MNHLPLDVRLKVTLLVMVSAIGFGGSECRSQDITPPTLVSATGHQTLDRVTVAYSEPMEPWTAEDPFNYEIQDEEAKSLMVLACTLDPAGDSVTLTTESQTPGMLYTVQVLGGQDLAGNKIAPNSSIQFRASQDTLQRPGDCNQDGTLDISDGICLLGNLFLGTPARLPCGSGIATEPGNTTLLDANGDGIVDLSDGIVLFSFLFLGGPPHVLGTGCVAIEDCPDVCTQ